MLLFNVISLSFTSILIFLFFLLLFGFILPQFTSVYDDLNADLPIYTQMLLDTSDWVSNNLYLTSLIYLLSHLGFILFLNRIDRTKLFRYKFLKNPITGVILFLIGFILLILFIIFILIGVYMPIFKFGSAL